MLSDPETQRKGFEMAVRQYGEQLYWQVRRIVLTHDDANDVMQNVFVKAWTHLDTFRNASRLSTWLYRIAINGSLNFVQKQKKHFSLDEDSSVVDFLMSDEFFDGDELQAQLQEVIARLPEKPALCPALAGCRTGRARPDLSGRLSPQNCFRLSALPALPFCPAPRSAEPQSRCFFSATAQGVPLHIITPAEI